MLGLEGQSYSSRPPSAAPSRPASAGPVRGGAMGPAGATTAPPSASASAQLHPSASAPAVALPTNRGGVFGVPGGPHSSAVGNSAAFKPLLKEQGSDVAGRGGPSAPSSRGGSKNRDAGLALHGVTMGRLSSAAGPVQGDVEDGSGDHNGHPSGTSSTGHLVRNKPFSSWKTPLSAHLASTTSPAASSRRGRAGRLSHRELQQLAAEGKAEQQQLLQNRDSIVLDDAVLEEQKQRQLAIQKRKEANAVSPSRAYLLQTNYDLQPPGARNDVGRRRRAAGAPPPSAPPSPLLGQEDFLYNEILRKCPLTDEDFADEFAALGGVDGGEEDFDGVGIGGCGGGLVGGPGAGGRCGSVDLESVPMECSRQVPPPTRERSKEAIDSDAEAGIPVLAGKSTGGGKPCVQSRTETMVVADETRTDHVANHEHVQGAGNKLQHPVELVDAATSVQHAGSLVCSTTTAPGGAAPALSRDLLGTIGNSEVEHQLHSTTASPNSRTRSNVVGPRGRPADSIELTTESESISVFLEKIQLLYSFEPKFEQLQKLLLQLEEEYDAELHLHEEGAKWSQTENGRKGEPRSTQQQHDAASSHLQDFERKLRNRLNTTRKKLLTDYVEYLHRSQILASCFAVDIVSKPAPRGGDAFPDDEAALPRAGAGGGSSKAKAGKNAAALEQDQESNLDQESSMMLSVHSATFNSISTFGPLRGGRSVTGTSLVFGGAASGAPGNNLSNCNPFLSTTSALVGPGGAPAARLDLLGDPLWQPVEQLPAGEMKSLHLESVLEEVDDDDDDDSGGDHLCSYVGADTGGNNGMVVVGAPAPEQAEIVVRSGGSPVDLGLVALATQIDTDAAPVSRVETTAAGGAQPKGELALRTPPAAGGAEEQAVTTGVSSKELELAPPSGSRPVSASRPQSARRPQSGGRSRSRPSSATRAPAKANFVECYESVFFLPSEFGKSLPLARFFTRQLKVQETAIAAFVPNDALRHENAVLKQEKEALEGKLEEFKEEIRDQLVKEMTDVYLDLEQKKDAAKKDFDFDLKFEKHCLQKVSAEKKALERKLASLEAERGAFDKAQQALARTAWKTVLMLCDDADHQDLARKGGEDQHEVGDTSVSGSGARGETRNDFTKRSLKQLLGELGRNYEKRFVRSAARPSAVGSSRPASAGTSRPQSATASRPQSAKSRPGSALRKRAETDPDSESREFALWRCLAKVHETAESATDLFDGDVAATDAKLLYEGPSPARSWNWKEHRPMSPAARKELDLEIYDRVEKDVTGCILPGPGGAATSSASGGAATGTAYAAAASARRLPFELQGTTSAVAMLPGGADESPALRSPSGQLQLHQHQQHLAPRTRPVHDAAPEVEQSDGGAAAAAGASSNASRNRPRLVQRPASAALRAAAARLERAVESDSHLALYEPSAAAKRSRETTEKAKRNYFTPTAGWTRATPANVLKARPQSAQQLSRRLGGALQVVTASGEPGARVPALRERRIPVPVGGSGRGGVLVAGVSGSRSVVQSPRRRSSGGGGREGICGAADGEAGTTKGDAGARKGAAAPKNPLTNTTAMGAEVRLPSSTPRNKLREGVGRGGPEQQAGEREQSLFADTIKADKSVPASLLPVYEYFPQLYKGAGSGKTEEDHNLRGAPDGDTSATESGSASSSATPSGPSGAATPMNSSSTAAHWNYIYATGGLNLRARGAGRYNHQEFLEEKLAEKFTLPPSTTGEAKETRDEQLSFDVDSVNIYNGEAGGAFLTSIT